MRAMKDSGIAWIGEIPEEWKICKIKQLADQNEENSFVDGDWIESPYIMDSGIRYLTTGNIGDGVFKEQGNGFISLRTFEKLSCKYAFPGDLIFSRLNAPYGRSCILPSDFTEYVVAVDNVILRTQEDKRYICYVSQCDGYKQAVDDEAKGTTMRRISRTNLGNIVIPLPPIQQQRRIADYLDRKCGQIDAIIARQQEVIEKLKAYKLSVITEAVTKGLNPHAPMKDSGVEWIGEIPEQWSVVPLTKQLKSIVDYRGKTPEKVDTGVFLVTAKNIKNGKIDYEISTEYVKVEDYEEIMHRGIPQIGDVLFTTEAPLGQVANVDRTDIALAQRIIKFSTNEHLNSYYLKYWIMSIGFQNFLMALSTGSTALGIKASKLFMLPITLPSIKEQQQIVTYLDNKCVSTEAAIMKKSSLIDSLIAYKKSLIYEVVTGKKEV